MQKRPTSIDWCWPFIWTSRQHLFRRAFETMGGNFTIPAKHRKSPGAFNAFVTYAFKRARSNHPHNAKWKPLLDTYTVLLVIQKLES